MSNRFVLALGILALAVMSGAWYSSKYPSAPAAKPITSYTLVIVANSPYQTNITTIPGFTADKNCEVTAQALHQAISSETVETHCEPVW